MIETMQATPRTTADRDGSQRRYWICQLTGWIGYSLVGITINLSAGAAPLPLLVGHAAMIASGIGLTHIFRGIIRKRRSPDQPFRRIWPTLVSGAIAIGLALTVQVVLMNIALTQNRWDAVSIGALGWGMVLASGVWTLLYVRFSERKGHVDRENQLLLSLREAQLRALESQINPHFLFNCLNSIRALVEIEPARAQDMLTKLSNVLRSSLRHDDHHTALLSDEIEVVRDYLALETVRFGDRLSATVRLEEAAAAVPVPPMMVQTLVENAIKHGIGRVAGHGQLVVEAGLQERVLVILVENTGTLDAAPRGSGHLGLKNVRERLALLYGDRASLGLEEREGRVRARVVIPAQGN